MQSVGNAMERGSTGGDFRVGVAASWLLTVALALAVTGALAGCAGGQSGGEVETPVPDLVELVPCPCWISNKAVAVMATLQYADACEVRAVVDDVLAGADRAPVEAGETLSGEPVTCGDTEPVEAGAQVLLLYAPEEAPAEEGPIDPAASGAADPASSVEAELSSVPARIFYTRADAPIHIDLATEPLPSDLNEALPVLLDLTACRQWLFDHPPPVPTDDAHPPGSQQDPDGPFPADPDEPITRVADGPVGDDEEATPPCGP